MARAPSLNRPNRRRPPFKERIVALALVRRLIRLVWETQPWYAAAMVLLRFLRSGVLLATLWVGKLIIDEVVGLAEHRTHSSRHIWQLVAFEVGIAAAGDFLARASALIESLLGDLFTKRLSIRIMEHAATLDLHQLEDPAFYDRLERALQATAGRISLLTQVFALGQVVLTLVSLGAALAAQAAWLLVLLLIAVLPSFLGETHFAGLSYALNFRWTPQRRELDYVRYLGASERTAKEVQLFGLAPWLIDRYRSLSDRFYDANRRLAVQKLIVGFVLSLLGMLGYYGAYVAILVRTASGSITVGMLTFLAASFRQSRDLIQQLLTSTSGIYEQTLYLKDLFFFLDIRPSIRRASKARPVPRSIAKGFVFEDVGFQYPGSDRWAVRHLSLSLRPGERVALVGENGAGKTTFTKLLARLYDPTEGRILLDDVDLREYDLDDVRRTIGVIFQDFVRYDMRFDENVGVGEVESVRHYLDAEHADGSNGLPEAIVRAADKSLASTLLPRLPGAYRQMLGRRFDDGVDLSGGEWQKVALARAYMRDAQLLILDEPTAALDPRAEYEVFLRFNALTAGRMAVVISHRFSTVRMAGRIIVLTKGEVAEDGTHNQLVRSKGLYAELFALQAAGYQ